MKEVKKGLFYHTFCKIDGLNIKLTSLVQIREWDVSEDGRFLEATERYTDLYRITVDLSTGMYTDDYMAEEGTDLYNAVTRHFSVEYVKKDGMAMLDEYIRGMSCELPYHKEYGQETFHMDLDGLEWDDQYVSITAALFE